VLGPLETGEHGVARPSELGGVPQVAAGLAGTRPGQAPAIAVPSEGTARLRQGVARERRLALAEAARRQSRQRRRQRVDGDTRHGLRDLETGLLRAVGVPPANAPAASGTAAIGADLQAQTVPLVERPSDRGELRRRLVRERPAARASFCTAWPGRNSGRLPKTTLTVDWEPGLLRCPHAVPIPGPVDSVVHVPATACRVCPLQVQGPSRPQGRSVSMHPDARRLGALRERQQSPAGRAKRRARGAVEHALAHVGRWPGRRARSRGLRTTVCAVRRAAVMHNVQVLARLSAGPQHVAAGFMDRCSRRSIPC